MDTIWTIVFMFVTPIVATIAALFPIIIVIVDMFMHILTKLDEHGVDFPFFKVYCLSPSFAKHKDASTSWENWISTIKECKFGTKLIKESSCELIEFRDPFPSIFLLTIFGCLFVYMLALFHCIRFGFPCSKRKTYSPKGGVTHTTLILFLSFFGYIGAYFVNNYKCTDFELTIRSLLFLVTLLNTIIPLLSNERYGGVLFFFSSSSLILSLTMNNSTANKSTLHEDHGYSFQNASYWNLIIILAGVLLLASPLLNQLRFYGFSNYYGHRISFSYYPTCGEQEEEEMSSAWHKFITAIDKIFLFFRFPFSLRGGFFHINESSMDNLIPSSSVEYMSQISVHNVSENYDDPKRFANDWTISKDMLIASSKKGYYSLEVKSTQEEIRYLKAYNQILVQRIINAQTKILKLRIQELRIGIGFYNNDIEELRRIIRDSYENYLDYERYFKDIEKSMNNPDDKKISIASVTAVSGGAVSPYLGDQITNYPNSMLSLCGGLCGRWIHIEKVWIKSFPLSIIISIFFTISSIILVFHGVELYHNCGDSFNSCDLALETDEIDNLFAFEIFLFVVICLSTMGTIFIPDFIQRNRLISHPFMISLVSMLSLPFKWKDISAVYASDGGHYENLGIIPLLLHREVENEDIIISVDASEEQTLKIEKKVLEVLEENVLGVKRDGEYFKQNDYEVGKSIFFVDVHGDVKEGNFKRREIIQQGGINNQEPGRRVIYYIEEIREEQVLEVLGKNILGVKRDGKYFKQNDYEVGKSIFFVDEHGNIKEGIFNMRDMNQEDEISYQQSENKAVYYIEEIKNGKYYEFPSGFLKALRKTNVYNAHRYEFEYKVEYDNLKNFLGEDAFKMLSVDDLKLLGCDRINIPNEQEQHLQQQEKPRYLRVQVTRYDKYYKRKVNLILYHIRPQVSDLENDPGLDLLGPGCCKSRGIHGRHFEEDERRNPCRDLGNIGFDEMILDLQQYISILLFLTAIVVMINGVVYLMGMYTFLEIYETDSDLTIPTLISLLVGILFVVASFATGFRLIGVLLIAISTAPNFLSTRLDKSATLSWFFVILCVFPVIILFVIAVYFSEKIFGTFPNHSTYTMQPFGNKYIFRKYREQGYDGVRDVWKHIRESNGLEPLAATR